jgi:hypothetical protein
MLLTLCSFQQKFHHQKVINEREHLQLNLLDLMNSVSTLSPFGDNPSLKYF